jgi:hypothetical protein
VKVSCVLSATIDPPDPAVVAAPALSVSSLAIVNVLNPYGNVTV